MLLILRRPHHFRSSGLDHSKRQLNANLATTRAANRTNTAPILSCPLECRSSL